MKKKWLSIFPILIVLLIVILADSGNLPKIVRDLYDFPYGDKIGHFMLMGLLNYALVRVFLVSRADLKPARVIWTVSLAVAFFVTLEELSQQFFPRRTFSLLDLFFDYTGIAFFGWLAARTTRKKA